MRNHASLALVAAGLFFLAELLYAQDSAGPGPVTLTGFYTWGGRASDLTVVLTPAGQGRWNAAYVARRGRQELHYTGIIEGQLKNGQVSGTGQANDRRTFIFRGTAKDGVITARHFETTGGREKPTGDLTLR